MTEERVNHVLSCFSFHHHSFMDRHQEYYVNLSKEMIHMGRSVSFTSVLPLPLLTATRYKEAEAVASRALALNPKLSHARFNRGLARNAMGLYLGAKTGATHSFANNHVDRSIDFGTILQTDPLFYLARSAYEEVAKHANDDEVDQDGSYALPIYFAVAELPTDFDHLGGKTCRFYNHDGCTRGVSCSFRHAPDIESIRDDRWVASTSLNQFHLFSVAETFVCIIFWASASGETTPASILIPSPLCLMVGGTTLKRWLQ